MAVSTSYASRATCEVAELLVFTDRLCAIVSHVTTMWPVAGTRKR